MKSLLLSLVFFAGAAQASSDIGKDLQSQYKKMHSIVSKLKAEFDVGGYLNGKSYGDYEVLWHLAEEPGEAEVIRIFRDKGAREQAFSITFHRNRAIVPGRTVIRRFVGPASTGWRNDTVDAETGAYLGHQGADDPNLDKRDQEILKQWLGSRALPKN